MQGKAEWEKAARGTHGRLHQIDVVCMSFLVKTTIDGAEKAALRIVLEPRSGHNVVVDRFAENT